MWALGVGLVLGIILGKLLKLTLWFLVGWMLYLAYKALCR